MPIKTIHVDPEVFLEHAGITVYRCYKDDDFDQGSVNQFYTTSKTDGKGSGAEFNIFHISSAVHGAKVFCDDDRRDFLRLAINGGLVTQYVPS
jgi:hypothetical protein